MPLNLFSPAMAYFRRDDKAQKVLKRDTRG